jgi:hypothetical protein
MVYRWTTVMIDGALEVDRPGDMRVPEHPSTSAVGRPRASTTRAHAIVTTLLLAGLVACAPKRPAPLAAPAQPAVISTSAPSSAPAETLPMPPTAPPRPEDSITHIIVPAGGEARVHDLVITALELREEQYDHRVGGGDVLTATLHVRAVGSPALSPADMAAQRPALVSVRSDVGAEGSMWRRFRFVVTGGDRNAIVLSVTPVATARSLTGTSLKLSADHGTGSAAGLTVTVISVAEKRTMEGTSEMHIYLHLRRADTPAPTPETMRAQQDSQVMLTSEPGGDIVTWNGFRIGYLGGWRTEVDLRIVPPETR